MLSISTAAMSTPIASIVAPSPQGFPVLRLISFADMPPPIPRRDRLDRFVLSRFIRRDPRRLRPFPITGWVGSCIILFGACTVFTSQLRPVGSRIAPATPPLALRTNRRRHSFLTAFRSFSSPFLTLSHKSRDPRCKSSHHPLFSFAQDIFQASRGRRADRMSAARRSTDFPVCQDSLRPQPQLRGLVPWW